MQVSLFPDVVIDSPRTEGIKYAGSKLRLLPHILQLVQKIHPRTVFDGFAGTTRVSQALARTGYHVICNDSAVWSRVFAECYLKNKKPVSYYQNIIDHLNALPGKDGWFTEHYGGLPNGGTSTQLDGLKKPWQIHNTRKLDAIREEIDTLRLGEVEKSVLLTSLIMALDKVESTIGHFAAYLSNWAPRAYKELRLCVPAFIEPTEGHLIHQADIFKILPEVEADLAYYDPPYGSNNEKMPPSRVRYAAYYHLWTTICLNDHPAIFGKVKRRTDSSDNIAGSIFEEFRKNKQGRFIATDAIERLLRETRCRYIILSYSSGGRATNKELREILASVGKMITCLTVDHPRNVMAAMRWTNEWIKEDEAENKEFLFLIEKNA